MLPPSAEAARAHHLDVLREAEGAGARDLALVLARAHVELEALAGLADRRVVELDLEGQRVALVRLEARPHQRRALALAHLDRLQDAQEALRRRPAARCRRSAAGTRSCAAEPSRIGTSSAVMSTTQVVEAEARRRPTAGARSCAPSARPGRRAADSVVLRRVSVIDERVDLDVDRRRQVDAAEHDAAVGRRRAQHQLDALAAVQADADRAGQRLQGALGQHRVDFRDRRAKPRAPGPFAPAANGPLRRAGGEADDQSACLRRNAGISISSMPLLASASTFAAAVRPLRHTLGVVSAL